MNYVTSQPTGDFDPVTFDLVSGEQVKSSEMGRSLERRCYQYLAIRISGNEGKQIQQIHELRHEKDFAHRYRSTILKCLLGRIRSREPFDHESIDDFLTFFGPGIEKMQAEDKDRLVHLGRLPSYSLPDAFDRIDDSILTDQTVPEPD